MFSIGRRQQYIILLLLGVLVFGVGVRFALAKSNPAKTGYIEARGEVSKKARLFVHVSGAVQKPGLYQFEEGARIKDALDKAVALPEADIEALNLAEQMTDGAKIIVPAKGQQTQITSAGSPVKPGNASAGKVAAGKTLSKGLAPGEKVNINTADQGQLDKLPGVGPATARKIIDYRNANKGFKSVEEIKKVQGIGDKKYAEMKDYLTI